MGEIVGLVPRIEAQQSHSDFIQIACPSTVLLTIVEARKLVKRDETATTQYGDDTIVITSTTVSDEQLDLISWQRELKIVETFAPDYHIPTDVATYLEQSPAQRRENVIEVMEGTVWMQNRLREQASPTDIIPLVKGVIPEEREICYQTFATLECDQCAFYGTQYLTGGGGLIDLQMDVETVAAELERTVESTIFLIGLLSPLYLSRMPDRVVAAAGLRWLQEITPRSATAEEIQQRYGEMASEVAAALGVDESRADEEIERD